MKLYIEYIRDDDHGNGNCIKALFYYGPGAWFRYWFTAKYNSCTGWRNYQVKDDILRFNQDVKNEVKNIYYRQCLKTKKKSDLLKDLGLKEGSVNVYENKVEALANCCKKDDIILNSREEQ